MNLNDFLNADIQEAQTDPPITTKEELEVEAPPLRNFDKDITDFLKECISSNRHRNNLNAYTIQDSSGRVPPFDKPASACYLGIHNRVCSGHDTVGLFLNPEGIGEGCYINGHQNVLTKEQGIMWLDYLANDSAYSNAFISKDANRMWKERIAYFHLDQPSNYVVGAMVLVRQAWEYRRIVHNFLFLSEQMTDISRDFLLYLAHAVEIDIKMRSLIVNPLMTGHVALYTSGMTLRDIQNLVNRKEIQTSGLLSSGSSYTGIFELWRSSNRPNELASYTSIISQALLTNRQSIAEKDKLFSHNLVFYKEPIRGLSKRFDLSRSLRTLSDLFKQDFT